MHYKDALKQHKRVGAAHAQGEVLAAGWANILPRFLCLNDLASPKLYEWLVKQPDVMEAVTRLLQDPMLGAEVALSDER